LKILKKMGIIKLTNIRTFSYHGCLEEEAKIGSNYRVDLTIKTNLKPSSQTDELTDTVDYVDLNRIVTEEMAIRAKLLEHVAKRIIDRILNELFMVTQVKVEVTKLNPPIGGDVEGVTIIMKKKR
jgi:dihydroneopterin aldolase